MTLLLDVCKLILDLRSPYFLASSHSVFVKQILNAESRVRIRIDRDLECCLRIRTESTQIQNICLSVFILCHEIAHLNSTKLSRYKLKGQSHEID